jgi:hypothetical protein
MALEPLWTGSELLRKLLDDFLTGKLKVETFCRDVRNAYNDAIDEEALTPSEERVFRGLFDEVVWYSPFPEERREIPNYKLEEEIWAAAVLAVGELRSIEQ